MSTKHGSNKKSPAMQRYVAERRWEKNKARKIATHNRRAARHREKLARKTIA